MEIIQGVDSIRDLYTNVSDDDVIVRAFYTRQNIQIARALGVVLPRGRLRESEIVARTRAHLLADKPPRPCSGCVLEGRRWIKVNEGVPLGFYMERNSLRRAFDGADLSWDDVISVFKRRFPYLLCEEVNISTTVPDVVIRADDIDGPGGTLGYATTFEVPGSDDLDVGGDRWVSAELVMGLRENWDEPFHFTVASHEWIHIWGIGHAPVTEDDIHVPLYLRNRRDYGAWTTQQIEQRYLGQVPA